jgi:poly-beta-1,6-N-acetyl-D-glucosamine synthase
MSDGESMNILITVTIFLLLVTIYVYVGYPLLLIIVSVIYKRPINRAQITPSVSLIIAAYNEEDVIEQKIINSLELDYPDDRLQIMVVADGSTDGTARRAESMGHDNVLILHEPERRGKSAALNRGVAQAAGEILVFSDANAFYYPDAIKNLVRNFNDPEVGCVSGKKTVQKSASTVAGSEGAYWKYESFIKKRESLLHSTAGVVGEMNAIRKTLFQPIPQDIINDDAYLALTVMKKGHRVIYEPEAISWESSAASTQDEVIRRRRINAGRYQLLFKAGELFPWKYPLPLFMLISHKVLRLVLPFAMFGAFILNAALLLFPDVPPVMVALFMLQAGAYLLALVGKLTEDRALNLKLPRIAYYVVSSNLASLQGFWRFVKGQQTVLWEKAQRG